MLEKLKKQFTTRQKKHTNNTRCSRCKDTIKDMLRAAYGRIEEKKATGVPTALSAHEGQPYYKSLKQIMDTLENYRGKRAKEFIGQKTLQRCDCYSVDHNMIIEMDEAQHFTYPRYLSLQKYPENLKMGFDIKRYAELCKTKNVKDNNPHFRDEQRAWYDTLRDFLPLIIGFKPTVRILLADYEWCSLNLSKKQDIQIFKKIGLGMK
jgi:hypothetical protein